MNNLNNFILYCKNWYLPVDLNISKFEFIKKILKLDGYEFIKSDEDMISIILINFSKFNEQLILEHKNYLDLYKLYCDVSRKFYFFDKKKKIQELVIDSIIEFIKYTKIDSINPPKFSKKLYKKGIKYSHSKNGMTYKYQNEYCKKYFNSNE